jgi:glycosyl hydrolase family 35/glycosyl hydrolase family 42 (putative beta-galactosidase)
VIEALGPRLMSGEIHYWRVDPGVWERLLARGAALGLPSVASYVQWQFHEYEPGRFDFTGETDPRRNLVRYLELVAASGLGLIIRPGPYTFAEWRNYGMPDYVVTHHRLHPEFQAAAGRWIDAVCEVLVPFLERNGGPIFLLQPDNMFDIGQNRYDRALGLLGGGGPFQAFLATRYGDVGALNAAWGTDHERFEDVVATTANHAGDGSAACRHLDFVAFRSAYTEEAARWTVERYRRAGIDVPVYSNATADQDLRGMGRTLDLVGLNHYPTHGYAVPGEHQELMGRLRLAEAVTSLAYVAELECGMWHGFHYTKGLPSVDHYWLMLTTVLAGGARGWNWYMLHDRDNWYMAPYNERGQPRAELVELLEASVALWRRVEPWRWRRVTATGVTLWRRGIGAEGSAQGAAGPAVVEALYTAGLDHVLVDLGAEVELPPLVLHTGGPLADDEAERLRAHVEGGGHLVVFWDGFDGALDIAAPDGVYAQGYMDTFHKDLEVDLGSASTVLPLPSSFGVYRDPPGEPIRGTLRTPRRVISDNVLGEYATLTELGAGEELTIGYRRRIGRGTVTAVAVAPTPELVLALGDDLGVPIPARPLTPATHASVFERDGRRYLVVLNLASEAATAAVALDSEEGPLSVEDLVGGPGRGGPALRVAGGTVFAPVPARNGTVLELRSAPPDRADRRASIAP